MESNNSEITSMKLEFDITQSFEDDINNLSASQREKVSEQINTISESLLNGKSAFKENSSIPYIFNLKGGLDSSLFLIRADENNRIIAAVDEDPISDKIFLPLFRLITNNNAEKTYKEVGEDIYKRLGILASLPSRGGFCSQQF